MALPDYTDLKGMEYAFGAEPFVSTPAEIGMTGDFAFHAEPFLPSSNPIIISASIAATELIICSDESSVLSAVVTGNVDVSGATYVWAPGGQTTVSITVATAGPFTVTATVGSVSDISDPLSITVYSVPTPTVSVTSSITGHVFITTESHSSYQWYKNDILIVGETSQTYDATESANYKVYASNANGCYAYSDNLAVTVSTFAPYIVGSLTSDEPSVLSLDKAYLTYQWYRDGALLTGATGNSVIVAYDGLYKAYVSDGVDAAFTPEVVAVIGTTAPTPEAIVSEIYPLSATVGVERMPTVVFDVLFDNVIPDVGYINFVVYENEAPIISFPSSASYISYEDIVDGYRFTISGYSFKRKATVRIHVITEI